MADGDSNQQIEAPGQDEGEKKEASNPPDSYTSHGFISFHSCTELARLADRA